MQQARTTPSSLCCGSLPLFASTSYCTVLASASRRPDVECVVLSLQALVLEIQSMASKAAGGAAEAPVEVSGVGFHGLLPKLDFFMLAEYFFRIDAKMSVQLPWRPTPLLRAVKAGLSNVNSGKYGDKLLGMLSFLGMQVGGNPDGAHAAFKDYAVDAVTARIGVRALRAAPGNLRSVDLFSADRVLAHMLLQQGITTPCQQRYHREIQERSRGPRSMYAGGQGRCGARRCCRREQGPAAGGGSRGHHAVQQQPAAQPAPLLLHVPAAQPQHIHHHRDVRAACIPHAAGPVPAGCQHLDTHAQIRPPGASTIPRGSTQ